jgi:hypothetical protein
LQELRIPVDKFGAMIKWLLGGIAIGVLGNLATDALKELSKKIGDTSSPAPITPSPTSTSIFLSPEPNKTPARSGENWIETLIRPADGVVAMRFHVYKATPINKQNLLSTLRGFNAPVYVSIHVTLKDIANRQERNLAESQVFYDTVRLCLESGVCQGFSVPRTELFEDDLVQPKAAYYTIMKAFFEYVQDSEQQRRRVYPPIQRQGRAKAGWIATTPEIMADLAGILFEYE